MTYYYFPNPFELNQRKFSRNVMKKKLYIILPVIAFLIIFINAFFGHLIFDFGYEQDINKYSIYVHFQPEWQSYPRNIIFDVTTVWSNPETNTNNPYYESELDIQLKTEYNVNELQYINEKPFVELKHEFSDCKNEWKPMLYRRAVDTVRAQYNHLTDLQANSDPYIVVYPKIINEEYNMSEQETKIESGYSHFIPICTAKDVTSYDYSVKINDEKLGLDVYFVPSIEELENYRHSGNFDYYQNDVCYQKNFQRFSGTCENVDQDSGLLIIIPDELDLAVTKITINLHEKSYPEKPSNETQESQNPRDIDVMARAQNP